MLLEASADPNYTKNGGWKTPVTKAVHNKDVDCLESLLLHGGDPNLRHSIGLSPIFLSIFWNSMDCLKLLIKSGANCNQPSCDNIGKGRMTPLHISIAENNPKSIKILIDAKADPNMKSSNNDESPVYIASYLNNFDCLKILLECKGRPDFRKNNTRYSSLDVAVKDSDCYKLLFDLKQVEKKAIVVKLVGENCPICLDDMSEREDIEVTNCYHGFHKDCWEEYDDKGVCPICRGIAE